jgi:hypothetical protein
MEALCLCGKKRELLEWAPGYKNEKKLNLNHESGIKKRLDDLIYQHFII